MRPCPLILATVLATLLGCAALPSSSPPSSSPPSLPAPLPALPPSNIEVPFDQAAANATDGLIEQALRLPAFAAGRPRRGVVLDPMLDASSGQRTVATERLQQRVRARLAEKLPAAELRPLRDDSLGRARYLLTGTLTRELSDRPRGSLLINLALTELGSRAVVAQAWALTRADRLDDTPLPFYADSPVLVKDRVVDGYVTTSATGAGRPADASYLDHIAASAVVAEATALYDAGRYADALAKYRAAADEAGGDQLRVLDGIYLASARLGRTADAETGFGRIVAYGIAKKQLGVKFLFNPGSTVLSSEPNAGGSYAMWLRQIARVSAAAKVCMNVVGHTSRTGSNPANDALSLQRAGAIRQRLIAEAPALSSRIRTLGRGARENIVGTGSDDAVDALDRRVEFKIVACG